jgi:hypothetical protein
MKGPKITILGHAYLVLLPVEGDPSSLGRSPGSLRPRIKETKDGHYSHHLVGKDKVCHTCRSDQCPAIGQVALYLKAGGERAPVPPPTAQPKANQAVPHRLWFVPEACPICGSPVVRDWTDRRLDSRQTGPRWRCTARGYEHFFQVRYGHLRRWLTRHTAEPPTEPQVDTIGQSCYEVVLPGNGVHIVGLDDHGAVCHTCNANDCAGVCHIQPVQPIVSFELPEPVAFPVPATRTESAQVVAA